MGPQGENFFFKPGISVSTIGLNFTARVHRFRSAFSTAATTLFPEDVDLVTCTLNATASRRTVEDLNPSVNFLSRDVERVALFGLDSSAQIMTRLTESFGEYESQRESSVEFCRPGRST